MADTLKRRSREIHLFFILCSIRSLLHLLPAYTQYAHSCRWNHPHTNLNKSGVRIAGPVLTHLKATPLSDTWADSLEDSHVPDATILSSGGLQKLPSDIMSRNYLRVVRCRLLSFPWVCSGVEGEEWLRR